MKIAWFLPVDRRQRFLLKFGFVDRNDYLATAKVRGVDIISRLRMNKIKVAVTDRYEKCDIAIFQKVIKDGYVGIAKEYKKNGIPVIFDINEFLIKPNLKKIVFNKDILSFCRLADAVIVSSVFYEKILKQKLKNKPIFYIPDSVSLVFPLFGRNKIKKHIPKKQIILGYCGYSYKLDELMSLRPVLITLAKKYDLKLLLISEKKRELDLGIPIIWKKYDEYKLARSIALADIMIAPRDLKVAYNKGHSIMKPGLFMLMGVPVVASPLPEYQNAPMLFCRNEREWLKNIMFFIDDFKVRNKYGKKAHNYIIKYSPKYIAMRYVNVFRRILR